MQKHFERKTREGEEMRFVAFYPAQALKKYFPSPCLTYISVQRGNTVDFCS